jgi:hypothetical protein
LHNDPQGSITVTEAPRRPEKTIMTTTTAKKNVVTGIVVALLDRGRIEEAMKRTGHSMMPDDTQKAAEGLYRYFLKGAGGDSDKLLECDRCGGRSPEAWKECPYCNEEQAVPKGSSKTNDPAKGQDSKEAQDMDKQTTKGVAQTALPMLAGGGSTKALATVTPIKGELMDPEVKRAQAVLTKSTEKTLDQAVKDVQEAKAATAGSAWVLGEKISRIYDGQLWKLRNEDGKPRYKTADAFCVAELGMSVTHAWNMISLHKNFTQKEVAKFGTSKLGLLLQAPVEAQPEIREKIERGATKAAVTAEVRKANKGRETVPRRDGKEQKNSAPARAAAKEASGGKGTSKSGRATITVANIVGKQTIQLFRKASTDGDRKEWVKAKRIGDVPFATLELANDVVQEFTLVEHTDGTIKLKVETFRIE